MRTAGTMMPSWKISVASGEMLPARMPPMSQKWPQVCEKATSRPRWNTGAAKTMSGEWETPPREPWQSLYQ